LKVVISKSILTNPPLARKTTSLLTAILLLSFFSCHILAQPANLRNKRIVFDHLAENQNLSQSSVNCVLQDRDGFLWIGTWSGLIRFDGYKTTVYHSENKEGSIQSNKIITIYEDRKGYLWIGTHMGGLFRYDKNKNIFINYAHEPKNTRSISSNNVWAIQEDKDGNLWVGTERGLNILKRDATDFDRILKKDNPTLTYDFITDIHLSSTNELWIATEMGLNRLLTTNDSSKNSYSFENYLYTSDSTNIALHNYIYRIEELSIKGKHTLWMSTKKGMKRLQDGAFKNYLNPDKPLSHSFFRSVLAVDGDFPYLITGSEVGLSFFNPLTEKFEDVQLGIGNKNKISHSSVTALYFDRGGVLWAGTKKGLNKFDSYSKDFESFASANFDESKSIVTGIQESATEGYWISTIGSGLYKFDGKDASKAVKLSNKEENDFTQFIQTLYSDVKGTIWVGTAGAGVYCFSEQLAAQQKNITVFDHYYSRSISPLWDNYVMSLTGDTDGNILVGTWSGGLFKIGVDKQVQEIKLPLLKEAPIVVLHVDRTGVIWVGTRGNGFYRIKDIKGKAEAKQYLKSPGQRTISNNFINAIYEDHAGTLWIGTDGGLNSFDRRTEQFTRHELEGGPNSDMIVSILEDDQGKIWSANWNGLSVMDPTDPGWIRSYDRNDRILGGFFYNNVCVKNKDGHLLFAGSEGFNRIDPKRIVQKPEVYPLVITQFELFGKPVTHGEEIDGRILLENPIRDSVEVKLKHSENSIAFEFASLDYAAPEKIRYAYKLEGFNKEWSYTNSERRFANYTNLNYGTYIFKVKATSADGVWSEKYTRVFITIHPPWWKTYWAVLLYIFATFIVLHGFRKLILLRANLIHDIKLERLQRENMEKLNRAKLQFFTNVSHEFRTPLTLILGPAQNLLDSSELGKTLRYHAQTININAQRLLRLVNQLLDFRKAESGNLKLAVSEGNLVKFVKEIKLSFDALADQLNVKFNLDSSAPVIKLWFDRDQFEKILFNLLSNSFKNTPSGGTVRVSVHELQDTVNLIVEDSGRGIKAEHFEAIFQTFFSYDEDKHHTGTGIGLALAKSLIDMHHGSISVESEEGDFTRFTIKLKRGSAHFEQRELQPYSSDIESLDYYPSLSKTENQPIEMIVEGTKSVLNNPILLLVEDNDDVRAYIKSIFYNSYRIIEATDGRTGLHAANAHLPDVIISDVMMPVMDGITFCKKLKSDVKTCHIPIILLTARTSLIFQVEGLETGADDYVIKPFSPKLLELKVKNLVLMRERMRKVFTNKEVLIVEPKRITLTSTDELFMQKAMESVEANMSNTEYTVEDLGREVAMSRMQLYRKLKTLTDLSANEFIRTMRLKRAAQLLEQKQLNISEVTYEVGFSDLPYFRECFKKMFGVTPSEYTKGPIKENNAID
jgi:signal transduction histidine kinase/ligand-binding sensor domain-containing protein/DNA-binding response OmpR family regulator